MSRLFNGSTDLMTYPVAAGTAMNDALSMLIVCKIVTTVDNTFLSLIEIERSGGGDIEAAALGRRSNGEIYFANTAGIVSAGSITDSDGWMIVAVTRTSAAATTVHKIPIGGTRTSTATGALGDGLSAASGLMKIAGNDDPANIKVAAVAYWDAVALTTAQLDGIATALTTQSIADLTPTALYDDSDAFATDLIGSQDRTSISGTTDDADDPTGWVYGLGGGGSTKTLTGTASMAFAESASIVRTRVVSGSVSSHFAETVTVSRTRPLSPSETMAFTEVASVARTRPLSPSASSAFSETADLSTNSDKNLSGAVSMSFAETASLVATKAISSAVTLTFDSTATLAGAVTSLVDSVRDIFHNLIFPGGH